MTNDSIRPVTPGELLEISGYYWKTCTLHAAVKLDVFTLIGKEAKRADVLASEIGADERALTFLLNALSAMGLLQKKQEAYANTETAVKFLSRASEAYIGYMILHHHHLFESWGRLDRSVLTGKPVRERTSIGESEWREAFLMGMFNNAMGIAPQLAPQIDLSKRYRLLDLGGGPGTYAVFFCKHHPQLAATVFDLETSRSFAEKIFAQFGMKDRISFHGGDYLKDAIPGTYDVAWLSHILHGEGPAECRDLVRKAVSVLEPGGLILIHDFILNDSMDGPLFPALFSLNMLLGTPKGQSYSQRQIIDILQGAGVEDIRRHPFRGPTESGILMGTAPSRNP
ncbi:MAG: methyltransferase domain-containing protein [Deltaproteobacteria bacterium]|nr:methyltransferase domain-containing protein [Deltaproteobacteria bacterium]